MATNFSLNSINKSVWSQVLSKIKRSVVFIDNENAECLHWNGGLVTLYQAGASDVREFSSFESCSAEFKKAVFLLSQPIIGQTTEIIKDIVTNSNFEYCVVVSSFNHKCHLFAHGENDQEEGRRAFEDFEDKLCEWMGNVNYTSEVFSAPLVCASLTQNLFLTPTFDFLFPIQNRDLNKLKLSEVSNKESGSNNPRMLDVNFFALPQEYQMQIKGIVSSLFELLSFSKHKADVFTMGYTSRLVGVQLSNTFNQAKLQHQSKVSVLFIDRNLDMAGPVSHSSSSLVDKMLDSLPELLGHKNNISINMEKTSCFSNTTDDQNPSDGVETVFPGCLSPVDDHCTLFDDMIYLDQNKCLLLIKRFLWEAISEEGIEVDEEIDEDNISKAIEQLVSCFKGNPGAIIYNNNLLQLSLAVAQLLRNTNYSKWKWLNNLEKILFQSLSSNLSVVSQIVELVKKHSKSENETIKIEDILGLFVYAFSLNDSFEVDENEIDNLENLFNTVLQDHPMNDIPSFVLDLLDDAYDPDSTDCLTNHQINHIPSKLTEKLLQQKSNRNHLKLFHQINIDDGVSPPYYKPIIKQVVEALLHPSQPTLEPDIEHISSGLKDFLKMGFSMFKKAKPPRPTDNPTIIMYMIGGITVDEVRHVNELVTKYKSMNPKTPNIILGSSRIISPEDGVNSSLFCDNLMCF